MRKVNVSTAAREAMAKEKARIMGRLVRHTSALERQAEEWEKKEEEKRRAEERQRIQKQDEIPMISLQKMKFQPKARDCGAKDVLGWEQYNPWQEKEKERKRRQLNAASIWVFARSLMAREWARALGKKREDPRLYALEREAAQWREKLKNR